MVNTLEELGVPHNSPFILEDNSVVASFGTEKMPLKSKLRYLNIHDLYVKQVASQGKLEMVKIPSLSNVADLFTKILSS